MSQEDLARNSKKRKGEVLLTEILIKEMCVLHLQIFWPYINASNYYLCTAHTAQLLGEVKPGYNISLYVTSSVSSDILRYQLIPHC